MARGRFGGGEGTYDNPYLIEDSYDLHTIRFFADKYFKLSYDINLGHSPFTDGQGWKPIQNFTGQLDGNGKTIYNLYINTTEDYVGLFDKYGYPAVVKNLTFKSVNITGGNYVGTVFGTLVNNKPGAYITHEHFALENISVSGRVRVTGSYGGAFTGKIGYNNGTTVYSGSNGIIYVWTAFKNLFSDVNLIKLNSKTATIVGLFGSAQGNRISNTYSGSYYHYAGFTGYNVINCGNFSETGNNNSRVNPIWFKDGYTQGISITRTYVNIDSWRKNIKVSTDEEGNEVITEINYDDGSIELTSEQVKDKSSYDEALVSAVNSEGHNIWQFEADKSSYPKIYISNADIAFIQLSDGLYVYENDNWVKKYDDIPDMEDAENNAMTSLKDIPAEAWEKLKSISNDPKLINIAKKQSTYYTGTKEVKATNLSNFATDNKKFYKQTINFFDYADGIFKIETTE